MNSTHKFMTFMTYLPHLRIAFQSQDCCWRLQFFVIIRITSVLNSLLYLVYFPPDRAAQSLRRENKWEKIKIKAGVTYVLTDGITIFSSVQIINYLRFNTIWCLHRGAWLTQLSIRPSMKCSTDKLLCNYTSASFAKNGKHDNNIIKTLFPFSLT